jgi:hypothetical protein
MTDFRAAMILKANTGRFGFNGEPFFNAISTPLYTGESACLSGGSAIVTAIDCPFKVPDDRGIDINYLGIFR